MRITVDTNVLISALGWNGPEAAVIELVIASQPHNWSFASPYKF